MAARARENSRLLAVSREPGMLRALWSVAEPNGWQLETAVSAWDAMERVQSGVAPNLVLLDLARNDADSLNVVRWIRRLHPDLAVIVTCFPDDAGRKKEATRLGAQEVLIRPIDDRRLEAAIRLHLMPSEAGRPQVVSEDIEQLSSEVFFVSAGPLAKKLRAQAELLAETDVPVLILGEHGSGKKTLALLIHKLSLRSGFNYLKVNCADMPAELLDAELFGNVRASDAGPMMNGKLESAEKGTILVDEIDEMPLALQEKLVQVLQQKVLIRPTSADPVPIDVRILAATSSNIDQVLAESKLRDDLYYRLSAFTVQIPPLRRRRSEIPALLEHFMHVLAKHYGVPVREFSPSVLEACHRYAWPGNLRELETFVKRYLLAGDKELSFSEAPPHIDASDSISDSRPGTAASQAPLPTSLKTLIQTVKSEAERSAITAALNKTRWNRKAAARLLRVSYRTLLYKIDQYNLSAAVCAPASPLEENDLQAIALKGSRKMA